MNDPQPPEGTDTSRPSPARLYDYLLGGKDHYTVDRQVGEQLLAQIPELQSMARANRAFLHRVVRYMARQGIDQFLDLGSGLPAANPTHEVAQGTHPTAQVVYVDHDPLAVTHARAMLATEPDRTAVVAADLRDPAAVLDDHDTRRVLDFDRPIGLLLVAVLHFFPDAVRPEEIVRTYLDALPPGSYIAISHVENETAPERAAYLEQVYARTSAPGQTRNRAQIEAFFTGTDLVAPGVVFVSDWPGDPADGHLPLTAYHPPEKAWVLGGLART
ncbi:SAM-dependent methyltransferase [Nocardiopsis nanhaiensis]